MAISKIKEKLRKCLCKNSYRTSEEISINEANYIITATNNAILIDVRSNQEYKEYHLDGAICIPHYEIASLIEKEVPNKNTIIIVYCQSGIRSKKSVDILLKKGYKNVYNIKNGLDG